MQERSILARTCRAELAALTTCYRKLGNYMNDFYCDEVLSGLTKVERMVETNDVLAYHHTRPFWPVHIVIIPKRHIGSLLTIDEEDSTILLEMLSIVKEVAREIVAKYGACRVLTNLGEYQDSKHLHWHVCWGEPLL
jgi:histidine triad (HIT) family protein